MISTQIQDGAGKGTLASVSTAGSVHVTTVPGDLPPIGTPSRYRFFTALLTDSSGSTNSNQAVNGSVNPVSYHLESILDADIHITAITVLVADSAVSHDKFGALILTNGWDLSLIEHGIETKIFNKVRTGGELISQSAFFGMYGDGPTSNELSNWSGTSDAQTVHFPIGNFVPGGLRIGRGTKDEMRSVVNDDLTGLNLLEVRVFGYTAYPS